MKIDTFNKLWNLETAPRVMHVGVHIRRILWIMARE